uniref:Uncharacterized protein n=1 Tax=Cacopsylla melanoneura TaxID=428564 RepID=A0A8D9BM27_9HEMI
MFDSSTATVPRGIKQITRSCLASHSRVSWNPAVLLLWTGSTSCSSTGVRNGLNWTPAITFAWPQQYRRPRLPMFLFLIRPTVPTIPARTRSPSSYEPCFVRPSLHRMLKSSTCSNGGNTQKRFRKRSPRLFVWRVRSWSNFCRIFWMPSSPCSPRRMETPPFIRVLCFMF